MPKKRRGGSRPEKPKHADPKEDKFHQIERQQAKDVVGGLGLLAAFVAPLVPLGFWERWLFSGLGLGVFLWLIFPWHYRSWTRTAKVYASAIPATVFFVALVIQYHLAAPLGLAAGSTNNIYAPGAGPAGLHFRPEYTDVRLKIANASDYDYHDLEVEVSTDMLIMQLGELSKVSGVEITEPPYDGETQVRDEQGRIVEIIPGSTKGHAKRTIRVPVLRRWATVELVMGLASLKRGSSQNELNPRRRPLFMRITGEYEGRGRIREIRQDFDF